MFIHIGGDTVVRAKELIAILDVNHFDKKTKKNYALFGKVNKDEDLVKIVNDDIKSIVITSDKIYYSPISSLTLKKRAGCPL